MTSGTATQREPIGDPDQTNMYKADGGICLIYFWMYFEGVMPRLRPINALSPRNGVAVIASVVVDSDGVSERPGRRGAWRPGAKDDRCGTC